TLQDFYSNTVFFSPCGICTFPAVKDLSGAEASLCCASCVLCVCVRVRVPVLFDNKYIKMIYFIN
ncbi:hypothetical protein P3448_23890, partial [Vibrio parahaemolyticus]|nr:hypothetical protein [Vibrio parahaemolyticus]